MAGISCALNLLKAGREVALIERDEVGGPATGASSGVLYYGSGTNYVPAVGLFGREKADALWRETADAVREIQETATKTQMDCGIRSCGAIMVAQTDDEAEELEKEHSGLMNLGLPSGLLSEAELSGYYPKVRFRAGLHFDAVGQVHPARLASGLAEVNDLQVYERTPCLGWKEGEDEVIVKTPRGEVRCTELVMATNLEPLLGLENHFDTESSVILASQPTDKVGDIFPEEKIIWTMDDRYDIVYPRGERLILELYSLGEEDSKMNKYFPGVGFKTDQIWGENWSKPRDWLPILGRVSKRTAVAVGMGDQGIIMSWVCGKKIPGILEGESDWFTESTSPSRFGVGGYPNNA
jgi:glycine/D-amino acid oxidase-like deaminating enzyme